MGLGHGRGEVRTMQVIGHRSSQSSQSACCVVITRL